jgi:hypothetical protein
LELSASSRSKQDLALHSEAPPCLREESKGGNHIPSLYDLIQGVVDELTPHLSELSVHLCGSHVIRTLFCVLGGVNLIMSYDSKKGASFRGRPKPKKKNKKKAISTDDSLAGSSPHAGTMSIVYESNPRIDPAKFIPTMEALTSALLGEPSDEPGELQQLACHESAGPLLIVLIRVLTYAGASSRTYCSNDSEKDMNEGKISGADFRLGIAKNEPKYANGSFADTVVKQILCWQEGSKEQDHASDVIYGLSGEARGSHLLETILRLCPDEFYQAMLNCGDFLSPTSLQDYVIHDVSNFVIQTLLSTVRSKEQAELVLKAIEKVISSGLAIDATKKRRGIVWRATELASKYRKCDSALGGYSQLYQGIFFSFFHFI